jgi:Carboxypeptidase regulatory-like domain
MQLAWGRASFARRNRFGPRNRPRLRSAESSMFRLAILALACIQFAVYGQNKGTITGKVTDAVTRQPIPKVHVGSNTGGPSGPFVGTLTGPDGVYTLEDVPAGAIRMVVNLDGYKLIAEPADHSASLQLAAGETLRRDFVMHPQGRIFGRLVDRDSGEPITGHTVSAIQKESAPGRVYDIERQGRQKGAEFNVTNLDPGDYLIQIDSNEDAAFVFPAEAAPKAAPKKVYGQSWYPDVARMDLAVPIHLSEGENRKVEISLHSRETHSVTGMLRAQRGLEGQPVTFALQTTELNGWVAMMPVPGSFRIDNLAPGSYRLGAIGGKLLIDTHSFRDYLLFALENRLVDKPPLDEVGDYEFDIADHDLDNLKIALAPYSSVTGEVHMLEKDAKLPSKFGVMFVPADGRNDTIVRGAPAEDGRFRQESLSPGAYWVEVVNLPKGYAVAQLLFDGASQPSSSIHLDGPDTPLTVVLTSRPARISGVVRDGEQNPASGADVVLLPDPLPDKVAPAAIRTQKSAEDGSFVFADLGPGKYRALVLADSDRERQGDPQYLWQRATGMEAIEVATGQSVRVELKR